MAGAFICSIFIAINTYNVKDYINAKKERVQEFMKMDITGSFHMLNLLKFKKQVGETGLSGKEQYQAYMKAAAPFIQSSGAKLIYMAETKHTIIGPDQKEWDKVLLVEYPSKEAFLNMVMDPDYPAHLRTLALSDSRLILCQ